MRKTIIIYCFIFLILVSIFIFQNKNILTVVVPHHDLVKNERLEFWNNIIIDSKINTETIEKVIIIGPNHFGLIQNNIIYTDASWSTYNSNIDSFFIRPGYFDDKYALDTELLKNDHAVSNLVGEIADNFPNAKVAPFLIGEDVKFNELDNLQKYIYEECNENCILVASVDFSHYVNLDTINKQDKNTIYLLENKLINENSFNQNNTIEVDSPAALYIMQEYARNNKFNWKLYNQTNSAFGDAETIDTTSHVFGAFF